jgi:hypothetical protein
MHYKRVPVATVWRILRLRMEEQSPIWRAAANILNNQSRKADKERSSSFVFGRGANNASRKKWPCYETGTCASDLD